MCRMAVEPSVSIWGQHGDRPVPASINDSLFARFYVTASVEVDCEPEAAWALITTIERTGEFSPECVNAKWIDGASGPSVGARFEGTNHVVTTYEGKDYDYTWVRPCTVTVAKRSTRFSYMVGDRYDGTPACAWDVEIEPTANGCRITQHFQHLPRGFSGARHAADANPARAEQIVHDRAQDLTDGMNQTLRVMKHVLESDRDTTTP